MCGEERCRPNFEEVVILQKIGHWIILMTTTDCVQIQSVAASLSFECIKLRENKITINRRDSLGKHFFEFKTLKAFKGCHRQVDLFFIKLIFHLV